MIVKIKKINDGWYSSESVCLNNNSKYFNLVLEKDGYNIWCSFGQKFKAGDIIEFEATQLKNNEYLIKNKETQTFVKKYKNGFYNSFRKKNVIQYKLNGKSKQKTLTEHISKPTNIGRHIEEINKILESKPHIEKIKSDVRFKAYSKVLTNKKLKELLNIDLNKL